MSFHEAFGSKASSFYGFAEETSEESRETVTNLQRKASQMNIPGSGVIAIQRDGYLFKKPFYRKGLNLNSKWEKKYFVLKDSFLLWYNRAPKGMGNFSMYPDGCLPLGGCDVFPEGKSGNGYVFEISHPDFNGRTLQLKTANAADAEEWIQVLAKCKLATMENALYGDAQAVFLRNKGTELEKETELALEEAQKKAEEAGIATKEKQEMMEKNLRKQMEQKELMKEREAEIRLIEKDLEKKTIQMEEQKKLLKEEDKEKEMVTRKLLYARNAVAQLNAIFERKRNGMKNPEGIRKDLLSLSGFLDSSIGQPELGEDDF